MATHDLSKFLINRPLAVIAFLCFSLSSLTVTAESLEVKLPSGLNVFADYHVGLPSMPAVLMLHGFQQTNKSQPMNSLGSNLSSRGYTVLAPTLSLGINNRKQSMACEAIHTHTYKEEVEEISYWMDWLANKGFKTIIPVGFSSTGNIGLLIYNAQGSHPAIKKTLLISPNPQHINTTEHQKISAALNKSSANTNQKLGTFTLGYCKNNFFATNISYLSYSQYNENKISDLIMQSAIPIEMIIGSTDSIMPTSWLTQIKALKSPTRVTVIDQANHFFDGTSEFDLTEAVENILKNINTQ